MFRPIISGSARICLCCLSCRQATNRSWHLLLDGSLSKFEFNFRLFLGGLEDSWSFPNEIYRRHCRQNVNSLYWCQLWSSQQSLLLEFYTFGKYHLNFKINRVLFLHCKLWKLKRVSLLIPQRLFMARRYCSVLMHEITKHKKNRIDSEYSLVRPMCSFKTFSTRSKG